jgi:C-terminal processing protease CtpA/Prc
MHRLLFLLVFVVSYSYSQTAVPGSMLPTMMTGLSGQDSAVKMFEQSLALMQKVPFKKEVDWDSLVTIARKRLSEATTCQDAYPVINECLQQAQSTHSFVMPARNAAVYHNDTVQLKRKPVLRELMGTLTKELLDDGIGYIAVPWVNTSDPVVCTLVADSLQAVIGSLAAAGVTKWIIDLRRNSGGNCWPMLAGIGPLLGDGICGYFVRENYKTAVRYQAGGAVYGGSVNCKASNPVIIDRQQRRQIVVLTGPGTSSAGEVLALAFKGLDNVRLMGEPTAGFTTANTTYDLFDGSTLVLTVCREADRTGKVCEGKIIPDDLIKPGPLHKDEDVVKANAVMWLQSL